MSIAGAIQNGCVKKQRILRRCWLIGARKRIVDWLSMRRAGRCHARKRKSAG